MLARRILRTRGVDVSKARGGCESAESCNRGRSILTTLGLSKTVDFGMLIVFCASILLANYFLCRKTVYFFNINRKHREINCPNTEKDKNC